MMNYPETPLMYDIMHRTPAHLQRTMHTVMGAVDDVDPPDKNMVRKSFVISSCSSAVLTFIRQTSCACATYNDPELAQMQI